MTTTGMGPVYGKELPQSSQLPSKDNEASSNRSFNTTGLRGIVGIALQKCSALLASILIPPETQTNTMEKNKKSLLVPDICVDININTPIFEAVQGKAKLTMPEGEVICDEIQSIPFKSCMFVQSPMAYDLNQTNSFNCYDMAKPEGRHNTVAQDERPLSTNKVSCSPTKKVSSWTPLHLYNKSKTCSKNRKEKDRHNLQINIMEDMWQIADDHEFDSDNEICNSTQSLGCSVSFSSSNSKGSPIDLSEASFPYISSSIPKDAVYADVPRRSSECESEESFVMLVDMTTPMARIDVCSTSSVLPAVLANRARCRQISECSDDSIVFCYDENDTIGQPDFDYDDDDDSEEEETDDNSCDEDSEDTLSHQPDSGFEERKVQFNLNPEVHVMRTWDFAYRQARKGDWEMAARDRERFKKRILETENALSTVFDKNLRDKVYKERFSC